MNKIKEGTRLQWICKLIHRKIHFNTQNTHQSPNHRVVTLFKTDGNPHTYKTYKTQSHTTYRHFCAEQKRENTSAAPLILSYNESQRDALFLRFI